MTKTIYCPLCGRKVMTHDNKGTIPLICKCKKCKKLIEYIPQKKTTRVVCEKTTNNSSGKRFY